MEKMFDADFNIETQQWEFAYYEPETLEIIEGFKVRRNPTHRELINAAFTFVNKVLHGHPREDY